jgi:hypothetical protein
LLVLHRFAFRTSRDSEISKKAQIPFMNIESKQSNLMLDSNPKDFKWDAGWVLEE